ncbi:ribosome maturation factor RimP [Lachnospiraceae bacterium NSJ-29]|uniref:Ribosome maturation factor RimP n=1 Tax=Wansuia hejianensis TaxID=2763667 RepID=A0A926EZR0_9FIRM|nr:ribosome maturation factor RimP [Wansuia hejianensis]
MNRKEILKNVRNISESITKQLGFELVDLEYVKEFGSYFLRVYIDKLGGVTLDDCREVSELLGKKLDEEDLIKVAYYLEVSSPGLDRPLKTDNDLRRNLNKDIEIKLYKALNNKKMYEGMLSDFNEKEVIIIEDDDNQVKIPRDYISIIKLKIVF